MTIQPLQKKHCATSLQQVFEKAALLKYFFNKTSFEKDSPTINLIVHLRITGKTVAPIKMNSKGSSICFDRERFDKTVLRK